MLSLEDILEKGKEEMRQQNYHDLRLRKKQRIQRNDKFVIALYDRLMGDDNESNKICHWLDTHNMINQDESSSPNFTQMFRSEINKNK